MLISQARYLIIDLEATCSNDGSVPRHEMEIIEIGAVMLHATTCEIESEFQTLVRPVRHPILTSFCTELTSITQSAVDAAVTFPEALSAMTGWLTRYPDFLFCSWGDYDRNQFQQDCGYHQVSYPLGPEHLNLKAEYSKSLGSKKKFGLAEAVQRCGLKFVGTHHRGLDDARNIARVVQFVRLGS